MDNQEQDILIAEIRTDLKYIKDFIKDAPERFASKLSEKIVYGMVGIIIIAVSSTLVAGVVRAAEFIIKLAGL